MDPKNWVIAEGELLRASRCMASRGGAYSVVLRGAVKNEEVPKKRATSNKRKKRDETWTSNSDGPPS